MKNSLKQHNSSSSQSEINSTSPGLSKLESLIRLKFKDKELLKNAFVHRSYLNEHKKYKGDSNERMEFLGDSVLSIVVSLYLFKELKQSPEGELTQLRAALVRTETLAKLGNNLSLGNYLFLSKGEEDSGGRSNNSTMANTYEALIGAIYLDQGLAFCTDFIMLTMLKKWKVLAKTAVSDNKSKLQEIMQKSSKVSPTYKMLSSWGPDHSRQFEIGVYMNNELLAKGLGKNKQSAAQNAAKKALKIISKK